MSAEGEEVDVGLGQVDGDFAHGLHGVRMEQSSPLVRDVGKVDGGVDVPSLVVGPHDGHDCSLLVDHLADPVQAEHALAIHRTVLDVIAPFLEHAAEPQNRGVFDPGGDDRAAGDVVLKRAQNCGIVRFRAATGEDDFLGKCSQQAGDLFPSLVDCLVDLASEAMDA